MDYNIILIILNTIVFIINMTIISYYCFSEKPKNCIIIKHNTCHHNNHDNIVHEKQSSSDSFKDRSSLNIHNEKVFEMIRNHSGC